MKACNRCEAVKHEIEFALYPNGKRRATCKACRNAASWACQKNGPKGRPPIVLSDTAAVWATVKL